MTMKTKSKTRFLLMSFLSVFLVGVNQVSAAAPQDKPAATSPVPRPVFSLPALQEKVKAYRVESSESSWGAFANTFKVFLSDPRTTRLTATQIIKANPALSDLRVQVIDAHGTKLWTFPGVTENRVIFAQRTGLMTPASPNVPVDILEYPEGVNITDARIVHSSTTTTTTVPARRGKVKKITQVVEGPKFLAMAGYKRTDGQLWLKAYKLSGSVLAPSTEPFVHVPATLMQGSATRAYFSGNNLVIGMPSSDSSSNTSKTDGSHPIPSTPSSSSYQVVLKFEGNAFTLAEKPAADGPLPIAVFFVKTLLEGRTDIAKAWVGDPALINIPKYLGLIGKNPSKPYKLVAMSVIPGASVMARYRLVTYEAQDLILDIGRVKKDTKVKGIFVAPSDPVARNLNGTLVGGPIASATEAVPNNLPSGTTQETNPNAQGH